jgi:hypothetical protein
MPEANQYIFKLREILELLIKKADLHDGKWQLGFTYGLTALNAGPSPEQIVPGAIIGIMNVVLTKALDNSPEALVADAAVVNPAAT